MAATSPVLRASSEKSSPMTIRAGGQKSSAPLITSTGLGVVHDLLGLTAHQDAPHRA